MSTTYRTISNVELRIQWSGAPIHFYDGQHDGFPGAEVPTELAALLHSMIGASIPLDTENFAATGGVALNTLFDAFVGVRGPGGNHRWSLFGAASETRTSDGKKWQPGMSMEGIAFQLGRVPLKPGMKMDPMAKALPYSMPYKWTAEKRKLEVTYWVCFGFEKEGQ